MVDSIKYDLHARKNPFWRRKKFGVLLVLSIPFSLLLLWCWRVTPLMKDEAMIAYFQAHRAEFEEVIRRNRDFIKKPYDREARFPDDEEGMKELMERAGIIDVSPMLLGTWLPAPYNLSTAHRLQKMEKACWEEWDKYNAQGGMKLHIIPPQCRLYKYTYGGLRVKIKPSRMYSGSSLRYISVWKDFIHFPEPTKVEDGYLIGPADMLTKGRPLFRERVVSSLNYFPWRWKHYECVYRRIDARWYLQLCNGH